MNKELILNKIVEKLGADKWIEGGDDLSGCIKIKIIKGLDTIQEYGSIYEAKFALNNLL